MLPGLQAALRRRGQIGDRRWDRLKLRPKGERQAGDRAIHVERRQLTGCEGEALGDTGEF